MNDIDATEFNKATGYIKLYRSLLDSSFWDDHNTTRLFIYLLIRATYRDREVAGITLQRGQVLTSLKRLSEDTGLSVQNIRTCLTKLEKLGTITSISTNQYRVITIENYGVYQENEDLLTSNLTSNQQSTNKQLTTYNKENNIKNYNYITDSPHQEEIQPLHQSIIADYNNNEDIETIAEKYHKSPDFVKLVLRRYSDEE